MFDESPITLFEEGDERKKISDRLVDSVLNVFFSPSAESLYYEGRGMSCARADVEILRFDPIAF